MQARLNPYISFKDNARQAMEFYQTVFGGKLEMTTYKEANAPVEPSEGDNIMHAMLTGDNGIVFMAADTPNHMEYKSGSCISMSLSGDDDALLSGYFQKLSESGTETQPLEVAPWGDKFGMCTDQFGIDWMVNISGKAAQPTA